MVDPFHAVKLANAAIDDVRRRVQQETLGHRGHKDDPLYGIRRLLLQARETLSDKGRSRLEAGLKAGDPRDEVLDTWLAKESLRDFYAATSLADAARLFDDFLTECRSSRVPELHRLAKTMAKWRKEILAHHTTGAPNGPTEAVNLIIKKVQRVAHGFRNFRNYRLRLLLVCGNVKWQTQPTARIRGRAPRLAGSAGRTSTSRAGPCRWRGETKTAKSRRQVQLSDTAVAALRRHAGRQGDECRLAGSEWQETGLVFTNTVGRALLTANLTQRSFRPLLERAGLPVIRFHDLRHTAATLLLGKGIHPKVVSELLGHSQVGVTLDLYSHVTPTMHQEAARTFDDLLRSWPSLAIAGTASYLN